MLISLLIFLGGKSALIDYKELISPQITEFKITFFIDKLLLLGKKYKIGIAVFPKHSREILSICRVDQGNRNSGVVIDQWGNYGS